MEKKKWLRQRRQNSESSCEDQRHPQCVQWSSIC